MLTDIVLVINDQEYQIKITPGELLVDILRDHLGLTGTKIGCRSGDCGACTVLVDDKPVVSCLQLAIACQGKQITTIEGLGTDEGELHLLQEAFIRNGAVQCGYCTPGILMMAKSLLDKIPNPTDLQIRTALSGNLCRCTGYTKIFEAVKSASKDLCGEL